MYCRIHIPPVRLLAFLASLVLLAGPHAKAEKVKGVPLTDDQTIGAMDSVGLIEAVMGPDVDKTLTDLFHNEGDSNVPYPEVNGSAPTLGDAIGKLYQMLDAKGVLAANVNGHALTYPQEGTDNDQILVAKWLLNRAASQSSSLRRVLGQILLADVLMNEMTHVYQKFEGSDLKQCDAERDSHNASIKFLCRLLDAMTTDGSTPHSSIAAITAENPAVGAYLTKNNIGNGLIENIVRFVKNQKAKRKKNLKAVFDPALDGTPSSWGAAYYKGRKYKGPINFANMNTGTLPHSIELEDDEGAITSYTVEAGWDLVNVVFEENRDDDLVVMTAVLGDSTGSRALQSWMDSAEDEDELPEAGSASALFMLTPVAAGPVELESISVFNGYPLDFGADDGMMLVDTASGGVTLVDQTGDGLATGTPLDLHTDPAISDSGGFVYHAGHVEVVPGVFRFVFSDMPPVAQFPFVGGVWFDYDLNLQQVVASANMPFTLAESYMPDNAVGIERLEPAQSNNLRLTANPGEPVDLFSVSGGFMELLAQGQAGPDGRTPPLVAARPLQGSELLATVAAGQRVRYHFLPRLGMNVGCAVLDETGDGMDERIHLSSSPARIHAMGNPGQPPQDLSVQYYYELVAEASSASTLEPWENGQPRNLRIGIDAVALVPIDAVQPPLYAMSLMDLTGDLNPDEALAIHRSQGQFSAYQAEVFDGVGGPVCFPLSLLALPFGFEPDGYSFVDLNLDGTLDVRTQDFFTGAVLRLMNDGAGVLSIVDANGDADDSGTVTLDDHGAFVNCAAGADLPPSPDLPLTATGCLEAFDFDADTDVDLADWHLLQDILPESP